MNLDITYWQGAKYRMSVDATEVLEALSYYITEPGQRDADAAAAGHTAAKIRDRLPLDARDLAIIEAALDDYGQLTTGGPPEEYNPPGIYHVAAIRP